MFKRLNHMMEKVDKQIEKQAHQLEEQQEHEALKAYLLGHGHDRVHSQILLGKYRIIQPPDKC